MSTHWHPVAFTDQEGIEALRAENEAFEAIVAEPLVVHEPPQRWWHDLHDRLALFLGRLP